MKDRTAHAPPASRPAASLPAAIGAFIGLAGTAAWRRRMDALLGRVRDGQRAGRALAQRHAIELTLDRLARQARTGLDRPPTEAERRIVALAAEAVDLALQLSAPGRARFTALCADALAGENTLVPLFHLLRTAALQRSRGFAVSFAGIEDGAPFDLLLARAGAEAEVACDIVSAEAGRDVQRAVWLRLVDRIDPDLQIWLASHPGRYLLKLTLPQGLRDADGGEPADHDHLAALHTRIRALLAARRRADHDETAVLRLDPLFIAAAQAGEHGLIDSLRDEFGPEAHLAVTVAGEGVFVLAARGGRENEIAVAIRRRMAELAPTRLTGTRPGILAMFVEDTDRSEWRSLRERLELEGEARQFLAHPLARGVVAVTCTSRLELLGATAPDAAPDGEMRFRNPAHPAARTPGLAPAVLSSM
jgi:hypothetical protein